MYPPRTEALIPQPALPPAVKKSAVELTEQERRRMIYILVADCASGLAGALSALSRGLRKLAEE